MELNKYSKTITQDETQPAAQAMLYGIGLTEEDLKKAQIHQVKIILNIKKKMDYLVMIK